ncbi:MAG TPA: outer membrane lipid asymmetry maintenance protein MlaD [Acetobacteraceae bacterium]|nr:outer membrane lipid asymmetry maintenance protein MlaD [Acetobacteraceae bacterium]
MRRHSVVEVLVGAIVLIVAAGFLGYALAHSGRSTGSGYDLSARFDHIDGLGVGSDVRLAGVKIGTVTSEQIDPKSFEAVVDFSVRNDIKLPKDSAAIITSESLLGGKYISLQAGADDAMLQPGERITITQGSVSIEELLGKFIFSMTNAPKPGQAAPASGQTPAAGSTKP